MSIIFAEDVRNTVRWATLEKLTPVDSIERIAVMATIMEFAVERLYEQFDFPENWRRDPEAYGLFLRLVIVVLLELAPDPDYALKGLMEAVAQPGWPSQPPLPEPTTNRGKEMARRLAHRPDLWREDRAYNPARYGRVRKHEPAEFAAFIDRSAARAAKAWQQWRAGVALDQIDG